MESLKSKRMTSDEGTTRDYTFAMKKGYIMTDSYAFPTFDIEDRTFSKLILGHNPFLGGSYMSQARSRVYKERFNEPMAMERIIVKSIEMGVRGMMASIGNEFTELLKKALFGAADKTGVLLPTIMIISRGFEDHLETYRELNCSLNLSLDFRHNHLVRLSPIHSAYC